MLGNLTLEKLVFNVSKYTIEYLTGKVSLYKTKRTKASKCNGCALLKKCHIGKIEIKDYCNSYCDREDMNLQYVFTRQTKQYKYRKIQPAKFKTALKTKTSINYIKSELSLSKYRFSELQIKQALLYYYLCNSKGIIKGVEKKKLAEALNCTVKTIENNNKVFLEHNIFEIKRDCAGSIYVKIVDYDKQYEKQEDKKNKKSKKNEKDNEEDIKYGYMPFVASTLKKILNTDELKVNELRFLLRTLSKFDYNYKKKHRTKFMFNDIKKFLATNFHSFKSIKALADIINNVFKDLITVNVVENDKISIDLVSDLHGEFIKERTIKDNKASIRKLMYENNFMLLSKEYVENYKTVYELETEEELLHNLGELTIEYGYNIVEKQLLTLNIDAYMNSIENFGGFIRDRIKRYLNVNRAYLKLI